MKNGVINVYKEPGFTSHDVVAKLRGIAKQKKIGHTGTLDPDAVGVLPVCLGKATRICELLSDETKTYEAVLRLGVVTDTQDMSGTVLETYPVSCTEEAVVQAVKSFLGEGEQIPPMYSAIKQNGKKLYELARAGKTVERKPRPVHFYELDILKLDLPLVTLRVTCSKGTYIRTLCHDIGTRLGCGGCMEHLTRTRVGSFPLSEARTLSEIQALADAGRLEDCLIPTDEIFSGLRGVHTLKAADAAAWNGNSIPLANLAEPAVCFEQEGTCEAERTPLQEDESCRLYDSEGNFIGIFCRRGELLKPQKMLGEGRPQ